MTTPFAESWLANTGRVHTVYYMYVDRKGSNMRTSVSNTEHGGKTNSPVQTT